MPMRGRGIVALAVCVSMGHGGAALGDDERERLRAGLEDVPGATAHRYDAKDDRGAALDGLDVVETPAGYVGVHHALIDGRFEVRVATSQDLMHWTHRSTLGRDGAQPSIAALPEGGFVVAYEWGNTLGLLPRTELPSQVAGPTRLWMANHNQVRVRAYPTLGALLSGRPTRTFTAPLTASPTDEGTPDVRVRESGADLDDVVIELGFHYFADLNGDDVPDADRQAEGTLRGLREWSSAPRPDIDRLFLEAPKWHDDEFARPPRGSIGDRDVVRWEGTDLVLHEAQYRRHDFSTWRLFLRDAAGGPAEPLRPRTHRGSRAFGNASATVLTAPSGRTALFASMFVFSEAAAPGEAGSLLLLREDP